MISILQASKKTEIRAIEEIARIIWHEHYTPIIGKAQVEYMLSKFQSMDAMHVQLQEGYRYYSVMEHSGANNSNTQEELHLIGYTAIKPEADALFISKFYLLESERGKGYGKKMLQFIRERALESNLNLLRLTVNKYNLQSIKAYEKMGFVKREAAVFDIGNGYVMDDFVMEIALI